MYPALVSNLPNYASAIVTRQEVTDAILGQRLLAQIPFVMSNTH
ncbi:MAG: hypothetical protein ACREBW_02940 [Candidatus Micrarchaeaceae archaeon]